MKNTLQQVFHSGKFVAGFCIFTTIVVVVIIFPMIVRIPPLTIISQSSIQGSFLPPGIYVNVFDSIDTKHYPLILKDAATRRIASKLSDADRTSMKEWLVAAGIPDNQIDITNTKSLLDLWAQNYDPKKQLPGMTFAKIRAYQRLNNSLQGILSTEGVTVSETGTVSGTLQTTFTPTDYINIREVPNLRILPFGDRSNNPPLPPGIYVNVYDSLNTTPYILNLENAPDKRIASKLSDADRTAIKEWLLAAGIPANKINTQNTSGLLDLWQSNYDPTKKFPGMTDERVRFYQNLDQALQKIISSKGVTFSETDPVSDTLRTETTISQNDYVNIFDVPNIYLMLLGTEPFGRDVVPELVSATRTSLLIGLVAGLIATSIGTVLGLAAGYVGGAVDDVIMFFTNIFTVIPTFVLLILISFSIGQEKRGPWTIAIVIGFTSWYWTTRAVRSQVFSLRNRDHVSLSKISGHPVARIIFADILPYIASYIFMALILQISSAILAEAGLSILGLGPKTTTTPTLGLMLNWAFIYMAPSLGKWWAYIPVIIVIALVSFSLNLMNTGLDQVYNPALRE